MNKVYVYSTSSADNNYTIRNDSGVSLAKITIAGKANVIDRVTFITKEGALTVLDQDKYDKIKDHYYFKKDIENGFLSVEQKNVEVDKVVKSMTKKDKSAQKQKEDLAHLSAKVVE